MQVHIITPVERGTSSIFYTLLVENIMTKNMGLADRVIRTVVALVIVVMLLIGVVTGTPGVILGIIAAILLLTSAIGFCPVYAAINFSTRRKTRAATK